ncbi:MAG: zinc metallopeptidase, partial [Planctomycetaceae bacterium]
MFGIYFDPLYMVMVLLPGLLLSGVASMMVKSAFHKYSRIPTRQGFTGAQAAERLLHQAGIQAMIGTPTAAPPAWLTTHYPEVLGTRKDGTRKSHGQRKHY